MKTSHKVALAIFAVIVVVCGGIGLAIIITDTARVVSESNESGEPIERSAAPDAEPAAETFVPEPEDFTLDIRTTEKQCFGTAGCNVQFTVVLAYNGPPLDPDVTYELIYEVTGADGELISTATVNGDSYTVDPQFVSTSSEDAELKAKVTDVSVR